MNLFQNVILKQMIMAQKIQSNDYSSSVEKIP